MNDAFLDINLSPDIAHISWSDAERFGGYGSSLCEIQPYLVENTRMYFLFEKGE